MTPPSTARPPGAGVCFLKGATLNAYLDALRARTPLNASRATPAGTGAPTVGPAAKPAAPPSRFDPGKVYRLSSTFLAHLNQAVAARTPLVATARGPRGFTAGTSSSPRPAGTIDATAGGLRDLTAALAAATPVKTTQATPAGYRLPVAERQVAPFEFQAYTGSGFARFQLAGFTEHEAGPVFQYTHTFTGGSYTETYTATGGLDAYGINETPTTFPDIEYSTTYDPEAEYGDHIETVVEVTDVKFDDEGLGAVELLDEAKAAFQWPDPTPTLGTSGYTADTGNGYFWSIVSTYVNDSIFPYGEVGFHRQKYRIRWRGKKPVAATIAYVLNYDYDHPQRVTTLILTPENWSAWRETPISLPSPASPFDVISVGVIFSAPGG
jgi:hypothetical protein